MPPPRIQQATADAVASRHRDWRYPRFQALRRNLALLLDRPTPPSLASRDQFDPLIASAHTISRMSALYLRSRINRCAVRLHGQHASQLHRVTQCGFNTPLTRISTRPRPVPLRPIVRTPSTPAPKTPGDRPPMAPSPHNQPATLNPPPPPRLPPVSQSVRKCSLLALSGEQPTLCPQQ